MGNMVRHKVFIDDINIDWIRELALSYVHISIFPLDSKVCFKWVDTPEGLYFWDAVTTSLQYHEEITIGHLFQWMDRAPDNHYKDQALKAIEQHMLGDFITKVK